MDWKERAERAEAALERAEALLADIPGETLDERIARLLSLYREFEVLYLELERSRMRITI